jgi:hypothetical protein
VAFSAPIPGIEIRQRAVSSLRALCTISSSKAPIPSSAHCARMSSTSAIIRELIGSPPSCSRSRLSWRCSLRRPCGMGIPRSSRMAPS